jgi:hypothetical protein
MGSSAASTDWNAAHLYPASGAWFFHAAATQVAGALLRGSEFSQLTLVQDPHSEST